MAFSRSLSRQLTQARWKVKIFDKETREPPHVTIVRGTDKWRINLRTGQFMDRYPSERGIDKGVIETIQTNWSQLCEEWDRMYPDNPVKGEDDEDS